MILSRNTLVGWNESEQSAGPVSVSVTNGETTPGIIGALQSPGGGAPAPVPLSAKPAPPPAPSAPSAQGKVRVNGLGGTPSSEPAGFQISGVVWVIVFVTSKNSSSDTLPVA